LAYLLIFFLSFIFLSLELLLAILLSVLFFSPFFAISFAFLGLSIAGVFVSLRYSKQDVADLKEKVFIYFLLLGGLLLFFTMLAPQFHFFNARLEFGALRPDTYWNKLLVDMMGNSLVVGLIATFVFFCLGVVYSFIYKIYSQEAPRVYFFDLLGAAMGCIFGVVSLNYLQLSSVLILLAFLAFLLGSLLLGHDKGDGTKKITAMVLTVVCGSVFLFNLKTDFFEIKMKVCDAAKATRMNFQESSHHWNLYSRASLFVHHGPDNHQVYAFSIVNGEGYIYPFMKEDPFYLTLFSAFEPATLGFLLKTPQDMLILMAGAGKDMIEAYSYSKGKSDITGVELNPLVVRMAQDIEGYHLKEFFAKDNVHLIVQEGRSYIESTSKKFDSIILSYSGASASQYLGVSGPTTQFLYTKEAFKTYFKHLKPGGTLGVAYGKKVKIVSLIREALEELGYGPVSGKIILMAPQKAVKEGVVQKKLFSSTDSLFLLVKNIDFTKEEVSSVERNVSQMGWMNVYDPFFTHKDFNLFEDILKVPDLDRFLKDAGSTYHEDLSISTDNTPFIDNRFMVKSFFNKDLWLKVIFGDWDDSLRQAAFNLSMFLFTVFLLLVGIVFIILPMVFNLKVSNATISFKFLAYFSAIGLGFVFTEIALMERLTLLLGSPIYSFSVVLMSLLVSTAIGSICSNDLFKRGYLNFRRVSLIVFLILSLYFLSSSWLVEHCLSAPFLIKLMVCWILIVPLGFFMGMFFPQGVKRLGIYQNALIPWAWGLNGYMSIAGSAMSITLSRYLGFSYLLLIAALLYLTVFYICTEVYKQSKDF
jgi:hypothetical protein